MFDTPVTGLPQIGDGRIRWLAIVGQPPKFVLTTVATAWRLAARVPVGK
jgi:hypothetical protein